MAKKKFYHQQVYWNVHGLHDCEFTKSLFQKMYSVLPLMSWRVWGIACTLNCQIPRRRLTHWGMTCSTGKMRLWLSSRNIWSSKKVRASIHIIMYYMCTVDSESDQSMCDLTTINEKLSSLHLQLSTSNTTEGICISIYICVACIHKYKHD